MKENIRNLKIIQIVKQIHLNHKLQTKLNLLLVWVIRFQEISIMIKNIKFKTLPFKLTMIIKIINKKMISIKIFKSKDFIIQ
jgi:hypothetical protein